ncbi:MAG TPA: molybdopterin cofactor-binding domain-containing protein [Alphaproteobacteria bacterium]|nr:molybdopterin cofactor-binding domain-containing protein [Alphaproteobacteria bacterium]
MGHIEPKRAGLSRRNFIVATLTAAGGLAVGIALPGAAAPVAGSPWDDGADQPGEINAWIVIEPDDSIVIRVAQSEMGEGVFTSMPMIVAEELACDWTKVRAEYASAHRNIVQKGVYKNMLTGGSSAVRGSRTYLQQAGASARARLVEAAAKRWGVSSSECQVADSRITHTASGRSLTYGAVAGEAAKIVLAAEPTIKTPDQYTLLGKPMARLDTAVKINGEAIFGIDVRLPDMLYAAVVTCPVPGGTMKSYDAKAVQSLRGVHSVVPLPNGVAVVADRYWRAQRAALALPVEWDAGAAAGSNSAKFAEDYRNALKTGPFQNAKSTGDVAKALTQGDVIEALYEVPYLAHATMEPLNCTVHLRPDRLDIWMGTQAPDMTAGLGAKVAGLKPEQVFVHNCFLGGGFGRRAVNDELVQALAVAKTLDRPVKLVWSREEDMRHDRYRPQAAIAFKAAVGKDGMPIALHAQTAVGSIIQSLKPMLDLSVFIKGLEPLATEGLVNMPYAVSNLKVDVVLKNTHVPVMFWRSVGSSQNAFAVESFIDELAHRSGQDPYRFRRKLLEGKPEFVKVLDVLAEKSNWSQKMPAGKGRGIAIHESFGTIVGQVVEVAVDAKGVVKCERVVVVVDCGHVVNPRTVEMQMESGVIYGLTAALYDEITVKDGAIEQGNFDSYRMVKLADSPKIETHLALSGGTKWGGIGEPGTPPVAPALCNAIFAATGKRIRALPVKNTDLRGQA